MQVLSFSCMGKGEMEFPRIALKGGFDEKFLKTTLEFDKYFVHTFV